MSLPTEVASLLFPAHDWEAAQQAAAVEQDERPTWSYNWPAGLRLIGELKELVDLRKKRVCDLGCGRGLLGFAALQLGAAQVSFCDGSHHVLQYVDACIKANNFADRGHSYLHTWGDPIPGEPYDLILGGDILYRPECFRHIFTSIANSLHPNGVVLLSDPRQELEEELSALAMAHRLDLSIQRRETYTLIKIRYQKQ